jgi:hypothetical protein
MQSALLHALVHLMGQLQISGKVFGAERDSSNAGASRANGRRVHHSAGGFDPGNHAQPTVEMEGRFERAQLGVDAANVVGALDLGNCVMSNGHEVENVEFRDWLVLFLLKRLQSVKW